MLKLNPRDRISVRQALKHPFITSKCKPKITQVQNPINQLEFEFEYVEIPIYREQYMDMIYEEILLYHFPAFREQYINRVNNGLSVISHILERKPHGSETEMDEES